MENNKETNNEKEVLTKTSMVMLLNLFLCENSKTLKKLYDEKKIEILDYELNKTIEYVENLIKEIKTINDRDRSPTANG